VGARHESPPNPTSLPLGPTINPAARQPNSVTVLNTLLYLHGDHLGSVSLATDSTGAVASAQEFKLNRTPLSRP
jgi:hypothetical protein